MSPSEVAVGIRLGQLDKSQLDGLSEGNAHVLFIPLPSHGSSGSAWDVYDDAACAMYLLRELSDAVAISGAELRHVGSDTLLAVELAPMPNAHGVKEVLERVDALWRSDDSPAVESAQLALRDRVMDYAEYVQREELRRFAPEWLVESFLKLREAAFEIRETENLD